MRRGTRRSKRSTKRTNRSKRTKRTKRKQRGGAVDLPAGYDYTMTVAYTPKSDKLGSPDEIPRVGGRADFLRDMERAA
jgi:hypothetical protein